MDQGAARSTNSPSPSKNVKAWGYLAAFADKYTLVVRTQRENADTKRPYFMAYGALLRLFRMNAKDQGHLMHVEIIQI